MTAPHLLNSWDASVLMIVVTILWFVSTFTICAKLEEILKELRKR